MLSHHERTNMAISKSGLPQKVLELFDPRRDLEYKAPIEKKKPVLPLLGLAGYVGHFPGPEDADYDPERPQIATREDRKFRGAEYIHQVSVGVPSILERRAERAAAKEAELKAAQEAAIAAYDPKADPGIGKSDPMKTLFVARLDYSTTEAQLRSEFEKHGPIKSIKLIKDNQGKSRGYAFIEYEHTGDMKKAYKAYPDDGAVRVAGSKRWSIVDVERGRTVADWKPMRLGGGKGGEGRAPRAKRVKGQPLPNAGGAPGHMRPGGLPGAGGPPRDHRALEPRPGGYRPDGYRPDAYRPDRDRYNGVNGSGPPPSSRAPDRGERYGGRDGRDGRDRDGRDRGGRGEVPGSHAPDTRSDRYGGRSERYASSRDDGSHRDRDRYGASERYATRDRSGGSERYGGGREDRYGSKRERDYDRGAPRDRDYKRGRHEGYDRYEGYDRR